jgi:predicted acylesterase/phospholipase RssA
MQQIATGKSLDGIFILSQSYSDVSFRRREDQSELPQAIQFGLKGGLSFRDAVVEDGALNSLLRRTLDRYNQEGLSFDHLPIPFRCVATDLNIMQSVVFFGGPLPQAIRASISIPGVFSPVEYRGHYLVDGAIMDNLPTDIVKEDLHADVVIAVDLESPGFVESDVSSLVGVFARAYAAGTAKNERAGKQLADIRFCCNFSAWTQACETFPWPGGQAGWSSSCSRMSATVSASALARMPNARSTMRASPLDVFREVEDRRLTLAQRTHHLKPTDGRIGGLQRFETRTGRISCFSLP